MGYKFPREGAKNDSLDYANITKWNACTTFRL